MGLGPLELVVGSDLTLDRENLTIVRKFRVKGMLPGGPSDVFDTVASYVMAAIVTGGVDSNGHAYGPAYATPQGVLHWNSIQLHESHYAQNYQINVTYTPYRKQQSGTYMVRIEHAAGTAQATAGEHIAVYPAGSPVGNKGTIWNGQEVVGVDVPFNQTRIVVSFRHPQMFLNHNYLRNIGKLVGYPNSDTFLGYDPGEISYAGGNATESECEASAEYTFDVSRNEKNLEVGNITIAEKKGFDVISPVYEWDTDADAAGKTVAVRPIKYIAIIRPRGREWESYGPFGWGGP
jgi:hypothetical protein